MSNVITYDPNKKTVEFKDNSVDLFCGSTMNEHALILAEMALGTISLQDAYTLISEIMLGLNKPNYDELNFNRNVGDFHNSEIAEIITNDLWELGHEPNRPVLRIAFKNKYGENGKEIEQGGLCKDAFMKFVEKSISGITIDNEGEE